MKLFFKTPNIPILLLLVSGFVMSFVIDQEKTLYSGKWKSDSYFIKLKGSWKIIERGEKNYVVMGSDFDTKKAPDLQLLLTKADLKDINGKNALKIGSPKLISVLKSYKGVKEYLIPSSIKVSEYKTIIIHCEEYTKFWGGSPLN